MSIELPKEWVAHDQRVAAYQWAHRWVSWSRTALGFVLLALFLVSQVGFSLQFWWQAHFESSFLVLLGFLGTISLGWSFIGLPFGVIQHSIERKFQLSKQGFGAWFSDWLKGLVVGAVIGSLALGLLYLAISWAGDYWWALAWFLLFVFSILLAQLAPVVLIPIFMTLKPMAAGPLKDRLLKLCERFGVHVKDVYHLGMGEKTEKGNAAFVGLGQTKRIMIGDTLYEKHSEDEVEAVFAHELGHQVHNDLWKGILLSGSFLLFSFGLGHFICVQYVFPAFYLDIGQPLGLFLFFVIFSIVQLPMGVLQAMYSRSREWAADNFASETIRVGQPLSDSLERLTVQNYGRFRPNAIIEFLSHSHPAPWRRILKLRGQIE